MMMGTSSRMLSPCCPSSADIESVYTHKRHVDHDRRRPATHLVCSSGVTQFPGEPALRLRISWLRQSLRTVHFCREVPTTRHVGVSLNRVFCA